MCLGFWSSFFLLFYFIFVCLHYCCLLLVLFSFTAQLEAPHELKFIKRLKMDASLVRIGWECNLPEDENVNGKRFSYIFRIQDSAEKISIYSTPSDRLECVLGDIVPGMPYRVQMFVEDPEEEYERSKASQTLLIKGMFDCFLFCLLCLTFEVFFFPNGFVCFIRKQEHFAMLLFCCYLFIILIERIAELLEAPQNLRFIKRLENKESTVQIGWECNLPADETGERFRFMIYIDDEGHCHRKLSAPSNQRTCALTGMDPAKQYSVEMFVTDEKEEYKDSIRSPKLRIEGLFAYLFWFSFWFFCCKKSPFFQLLLYLQSGQLMRRK